MKHATGCAIAMAVAFTSWGASAKTVYRDLHDFAGQPDGDTSYSDLIADDSGRLYGTTQFGGAFGDGTLFRLTVPKTGAASIEILHSFQSAEGIMPDGGVLIGADGGLYGTTVAGGAHSAGTVYRVDPASFALTKLHDFDPQATPADGSAPHTGLVAGPKGLLYGTTSGGGPLGGGTVFAISPRGDAVAYSVIHALGGAGDGFDPQFGRLTASGNTLFGTTVFGGNANGFGTVFELSLAKGGTWSETGLYQFGSGAPDTIFPSNGLTFSKSGVLYGCAQGGPGGAKGAVYSITPGKGGAPLSEAVIYAFTHSGDPIDGGECAVTADKSGRLVGTSSSGGTNGTGTVFTLTPGGGGWTLAVPYSFGVRANGDAVNPAEPVLAGAHGYYYGTTPVGGASDKGAVFRVKP